MKRIILVLMLLGTIGYTANRITNVDIATNAGILFSKLQDADALSVLGRSANTSGVPDEIAAGADYNILRRSGTSIGFGSIDLSQSAAVGSSILGVSNGGTGQSSYTNGQLLIGNTTGNTLTKGTLTAGTGITITNGGGSITIAASGGGSGTTDWAASSATVNCSSAGTTEFFERMEGDSLRIVGTFSCTTAGSGTPSINIGGGRTFDTAKLQTIATPKLGEWVVLMGGSSGIYSGSQEGHLFYDLSDTDEVFMATTRASKAYTKVTNFSSIMGSTNTEAMNIDLLVPIN